MIWMEVLPMRIHPFGGPYLHQFDRFDEWEALPRPDTDSRYAIVDDFNGLYSMIRVIAVNSGDIDRQVWIYLLMSQDSKMQID